MKSPATASKKHRNMVKISSSSTVPELTAVGSSSFPPAPANTAAGLPKDELEKPEETNFIDHEFFNSLPIGCRFLPKDDELINEYLIKKVFGQELPRNKIVDVNLYQYNPETVVAKYRPCGEREWYFFTPRDRKYKNGDRPNRAAGDGFWKATGADRSVQSSGGIVIGYRKALVFYKGKQQKQDWIKTDWIMHEYRVNPSTVKLPPRVSRGDNDMRLDNYVLCRIYRKPAKSGDYKQPRKRENHCVAADAAADAEIQQPDDHVSEHATSTVNHGCQTSPVTDMDTGIESDSKRPPQSENCADNFSFDRPGIHDSEAGMIRALNHGYQTDHYPMAMESDCRQLPQTENPFSGNISFHQPASHYYDPGMSSVNHRYQQAENPFSGNISFHQPSLYSQPGYQQTVRPMAMADGTSSLLQHPYPHLHQVLPLTTISSYLPMESSYYPLPTEALHPLDEFNSMWKFNPYGLGSDPLVNLEGEWIHRDDDNANPFACPLKKK